MSIFNNFKINFKKGLKKFNFQGRSTRKEMLHINVLTPLAIIGMFFITLLLGVITGIEAISIFGTICFVIALILNAFAAFFTIGRRLQDLNVHGLFAIPLMFLLPMFYFITSVLLLFLPSAGHNKYGPNLDKLNIISETVENYIYYKYFLSNPIHANMTAEQSRNHNRLKAEMYLKLIPASDLREFEKLMETNIYKEIDFSKNLPVLNGQINHSEFVKKHNLENFDYQQLFSDLNNYAKNTQIQNMDNIHNKEFNS